MLPGWTVSPSGWTVRQNRSSPDITACLIEPPSPGPLGNMRGQSASVTECPANKNLLKKTFFPHIPLSAFNDEKENLLDPTCAKSFPELIAYTSAPSMSQKTLLIEKQHGTQLKYLPPLNPTDQTQLKHALVAAINDMGSCRIADRGCQNILVRKSPLGYDINMIDADRNWDHILDTPTNTIPDPEIHAANLAYLAESTLLFAKHNKDLFLPEITNATYIAALKHPALVAFFVNPVPKTQNVSNLFKAVELNKALTRPFIALGRATYDSPPQKYAAVWNAIADIVLAP